MKSHPVSVFQAIIKAVSSKTLPFSSLENKDIPIFHIRDRKHSYKMKPFDRLRVDFMFFRRSFEEIEQWRQALLLYFSDPAYVESVEILTVGEIEERDYQKLVLEYGELSGQGELCLEFLIPLPFKPEIGKPRTSLSKQKFIALFEKRFSELFGQSIRYEAVEDVFFIFPFYWRYTEIKHSSRSNPGFTQFINGTFGKLYLKGNWKEFLPFLLLGLEVHVGAKLSNSQGYYRLSG